MGLFSSNKSTTNQTSNYTLTDQSANAAEGAIAAGAGSNVNIQTADPEVARVAIQTSGLVAADATAQNAALAATALAANRDVNIRSLDTTTGLAAAAINQVANVADMNSRERSDVLNATNLALNNSKGSQDQLAQLASAALERSQTPDSAVTKQLLWVVGGVLALFGLILVLKRSPAK